MKPNLILCRKFVLLLPALVMLASCTAAAPTPTVTPTTPPPTDTPTPTPVPRSATIKSITGTVEVRSDPQAEFTAAEVDQVMAVGDELRTGAESQATVVLDDGTGMVIAADSSFKLTALEGSHETPVSKFFLNLGQVFTVGPGELPPGATYEIETPKGVATIRGSMLGVAYSEDKGTQVSCLIGHCSAALNDQEVELTGGTQVSITDQGVSEATELDAQQKLEWSKALISAEAAGVDTGRAVDPSCSCEGADLKCSDGTTVTGFPTCTRGASCQCDGTTLACGSVTSADSPVCTGGATGCVCSGPNLLCDNNKTFYNVAACTGGQTCLCSGPDLTCGDGTVYPGDPSCAPRTDCICQDGMLACPDGSILFNTGSCTNASLPCVCDGTTFVCTVDGQTTTFPNYALCGGGAGGSGGEPVCACQDGTLYCSDGSIVPGGC